MAQLDALRLLVWQNSKDGVKGRHRPESVLDDILHPKVKENSNLMSFNNGTDFDEYRRMIIEGIDNG